MNTVASADESSGNLRVETDGVATTNVHLTNSYLVSYIWSAVVSANVQLDTSDKIVDWVTKSNYSLIDVNILAQIPTKAMSVSCAYRWKCSADGRPALSLCYPEVPSQRPS